MSADELAATGNPLADALAAALTSAHETTAKRGRELADQRLTDWAEAFEAEHRGVASAALKAVMEHPETPAMVREVLATVTDPVHQTQLVLGLFSVGSIIMSFVGAAVAPDVQAVSNLAWSVQPTVPLSPAELALAAIRNVIDQGPAEKEARQSGMDADRFGVLMAITGEPPGPQELAQAYRRGFIGEKEFRTGILQSRIRNEWIPTLLKLRYQPPSTGEVIQARVQSHLTEDEAKKRMSEAGTDPVNYEWLYETAGRPPGVFELAELYNRGELELADLEQAIRESDIKDKYVPAIVKLARKIPPMRSVVSAIHQGVITPELGARKLMELGYNADDAAMFVKEATNLKKATHRQLAEGQVLELYTDRMITREQAATMLGNLNLTADDVEFLLELADHRRDVKLRAAAVAKVHTLYVSHRMTETDVAIALDKIGVDTRARQDLLTAWGHERDAAVQRFTKAELQGAIRRKLITQERFQAELIALGWPKADVPILYAEAWPPSQTPPEWKL